MKHTHSSSIFAEAPPDASKAHILSNPTRPFDPVGARSASEILTRMSSIGIGIAADRYEGGNRFTFDVIGDVVETANIVADSEATGVIYFGGGTPKNFLQQTEVTAMIMNAGVPGHKYAIQCVTDTPHWGGLSGCTFEEAQSWGKIAKDASMVTCHSDSTIAMPILVSALLEHPGLIAKRHRPAFKMGQEIEVTS